MFLFLISFLLVFISSYLLTSVTAPKKSILGIIYLFLIAFAQLVLTFEVLSLFTAIKEFWVIFSNVIFAGISVYIWNKKSRPLWSLSCKDFKNRVNNSFKLDKSLMWLFVAFMTFIFVTLILNLIMPLTSADAQGYHCARSLFWVLQGSLKHFEVADVRNLCLPINSEILYAWILLFLKKDALLGFFAFVGYLLSLIAIYNILGLMGYCTRKKLWVIFILSSFSSVIVQASGTETDIIIAGLILSSIFLFWYALKNNEKMPIYMASLAYALALGTKTTSIIAIPGVGLLLLALVHMRTRLLRNANLLEQHTDSSLAMTLRGYKSLGLFLGYGLINFLIFSSYNYVLNIIQFHSLSGPASFMVVSKNYFGIKGMISNFIKYIFMFVDFTGFKWSDYVNPQMTLLRNNIITFLHLGYIKDGLYTMPYEVNRLLIEPVMGAGVLGFIVFVPTLLWAIIKPIFKLKSKKTLFIGLFALVFIINLLSLSYLLAYMSYSIRFIMSFMVISSPVLLYSYLSAKNPLKYIIIMFSLFYLICISTHLWPRPFIKIARILVHEHHSLTYLRDVARCKDFDVNPVYTNETCPLSERIEQKLSPKKKFLAFINTSNYIYMLKILEFKGYKIDFRLLEDAKNIDFSKYDFVIIPNNAQKATFIKYYETRKNECKIIKKDIIPDKNIFVPCFYQTNPNLNNAKSKEALLPFQSYCTASPAFLSKQYLVPIIAAGLITPKKGSSDYYFIYKRQKN